jgi:hypothetical protein
MGRSDAMQRTLLVRVVPDRAFVLNSRERVPFFLFVEVIRSLRHKHEWQGTTRCPVSSKQTMMEGRAQCFRVSVGDPSIRDNCYVATSASRTEAASLQQRWHGDDKETSAQAVDSLDGDFLQILLESEKHVIPGFQCNDGPSSDQLVSGEKLPGLHGGSNHALPDPFLMIKGIVLLSS